jgi:hypothetical protein
MAKNQVVLRVEPYGVEWAWRIDFTEVLPEGLYDGAAEVLSGEDAVTACEATRQGTVALERIAKAFDGDTSKVRVEVENGS